MKIGIAASVAATAKGLSAIGASGSVGSGGSSANTGTPSFDVVKGTVTNQLADAVNGSLNKVTKTYVLSSDVTTAQELDRQLDVESSI